MPKSKFESIYRQLKLDIESEKLPYQSLMPSENQLIVRFSCSRNTVRRAISMLAEEGYVQPMHGRGVRVIYTKGTPTSFLIGGIESFHESAQRNAMEHTTRLIRFTELTADEHVSRRTGFPVGTELYFIQRVRSLDGDPCVFDINLFDETRTHDPYYWNHSYRVFTFSERCLDWIEEHTKLDWETMDVVTAKRESETDA